MQRVCYLPELPTLGDPKRLGAVGLGTVLPFFATTVITTAVARLENELDEKIYHD